MRKPGFILSFMLIVGLAAGCVNNEEASPPPAAEQTERETAQPAKPPEPVTLQFFDALNWDEETFRLSFIEPLQLKFPHVTLERMGGPGSGVSITTLAAAGTIPDILFGGSSVINAMQQVEAVSEIADLITANKLDLAVFDQTIMDTMNSFSVRGEKFGLPFNGDTPALFYNKDLFDRFGFPYPQRQLTWTEAIELGGKLTRNENGTQYIGFYPGNWSLMGGQLALPRFDLPQRKATFTTDNFRKLFETLRTGFSVPGVPNIAYGAAKTMFYKDRTIAMYYIHLKEMVAEAEIMHKAGNPLQWDMAPIPTFDGEHNPIGVSFLMISTQSKKRQQAFEVIAHLAADREVQREYARLGRIPVLADLSLRNDFAAHLESFKGKNIAMLSTLRHAKTWPPTPYDATVASPQLNTVLNKMLNDGLDVNTALRQAEEAATQRLIAELSK